MQSIQNDSILRRYSKNKYPINKKTGEHQKDCDDDRLKRRLK